MMMNDFFELFVSNMVSEPGSQLSYTVGSMTESFLLYFKGYIVIDSISCIAGNRLAFERCTKRATLFTMRNTRLLADLILQIDSSCIL